MGFALLLEWADPSPVRPAARFEIDDVAMVDLWRTSEAATFGQWVPRDRGIALVAGGCVGCGTDLAQWYDGAFGRASRGRVDRSLAQDGAARMLNLSPATVLRDWNAAKAWLYTQLNRTGLQKAPELAQ